MQQKLDSQQDVGETGSNLTKEMFSMMWDDTYSEHAQ